MTNSLKNNFKKSKFILFLVCFSVGLTIFINGFIPISVTKLKSESFDSIIPKCINIMKNHYVCQKFESIPYWRHYEQVVLVVIDALRADFVPCISSNPEFNASFPFMEELIKKKYALPFISKVLSPTVTLPRIKSLVTGGLSNFMDVLTNLNAVELTEDSLLHQAKEKNLSSIFYGDNTWLKVFPEHFVRSEGTHSFFVSDFLEVDNNVTRHLPSAFSKRDWDIMILHYLGVDHIGHAYGPHSHFLSPKLIEMDNIIKYMFAKLATRFQTKSLIIICGDHGMTSSGSHGGVSKGELLTPLIFINTNKPVSNKSYAVETIDQVDFAATLSVVLGLPIPVNSFGNVLHRVLHYSGLTPHQILSAMLYNLIQLFEVHKSIFPNKEDIYVKDVKKVIINHSKTIDIVSKANYNADTKYTHLLESYIKLLKEIKQDLLANTVGYKEVYIILGLLMIWLSLVCATISLLLVTQKDPKFLENVIELAKLVKGKLARTNLFLVVIKYLVKNLDLTFMEKSCAFLLLLHSISLFSSSFIEEEHQVWYFFISTIFTVCFVTSMCSLIQDYIELDNFEKSVDKKRTCIWDFLSFNKNFVEAVLFLSVLILHRLLRSWNQTGDKWQHLPDISDWLDKEENSTYISVLAIISQLTLIIYFKKVDSLFIYSVMCLSTCFIFLYQCHSFILSQCLKAFNLDLIVIPWTVYFIITLIILSTLPSLLFRPAQFESTNPSIINIIIAWILLTLLIGRKHNIPVIVLTLLQEHILGVALWSKKYGTGFSMLCYLILAMGSFFYVGNSNSLSTIDVYSGYVGLQAYQPAIVGFLITCNSYSTVVIWIMLMIYRMRIFLKIRIFFGYNKDVQFSDVQEIFCTFLIFLVYKMSVLAVYCIVMYIMKHHLFFLSVFAPKLFYEVCHILLIMIFMLISMIPAFWGT